MKVRESRHDLPSEFLWRGSGARCPCFFLVALARENDSSHFSLFSSLLPCNVIFRFHAFGYRVGIQNWVFLSKPCKRGAKQTTISNLRNMLFKKQHFLSDILEKICLKFFVLSLIFYLTYFGSKIEFRIFNGIFFWLKRKIYMLWKNVTVQTCRSLYHIGLVSSVLRSI